MVTVVTVLLTKYSRTPEEYLLFSQQTHKVLRGKQIVSESINILDAKKEYSNDLRFVR